MKDTQTRQFTMGTTVIAGLDNPTYSPVWSANTTASAKRDALENSLLDIEQANEHEQAASGGGEAMTKKSLKHAMADQADIVVHGICAYALDQNDNTTYQLFNKSASAIQNMKDSDSIGFCNQAKEYANTNILALAPYEITSTNVTDLGNAISAFGTNGSTPAEARGERHVAVTDVAHGLVTMFQILYWFDHWVGTKRLTSPDFYVAYHSWRKEVNIGIRHVSVRSFVFDSVSGAPVYKAKITASTASPTIAHVGKSGRFYLMSLGVGTYTITIQAPGYQTQTIPNVGVFAGKITTLPDIHLVKT